MSTISSQLFRSVVPGIVLALASGGLVLDLMIGNRLEHEFDQVMATRTRALMALTERENGVIELERYEHVLPGYADPTNPGYFVMIDHVDGIIERSSSVDDPAWLMSSSGSEGQHRDVPLPDGRDGRVSSTSFVPVIDDEEEGPASLPTPVTLLLAISREPLDRLLWNVHLVLAGTGLALVGVIVLLARRGIASTLGPLDHIGQQVRALDPNRLGQRVSLEASSDELERLTRHFNELLERLEIAFARERRFSTDVAHELRTPLAELRTLVEVSARWPDDETLAASFADDHRAALERIERTVSSLLALARSESGVDSVDGPCDLVALARRSVADAVPAADRRALAFDVTLPPGSLMTAGCAQWQALLGNLIDNACEYAETGTRIRVSLEPGGDGWRLLVANRTDELTSEDLPRMFERLWRKDKARSSGRHGGLGLSLVAAYAAQLGIGIDASLEHGLLLVDVGGIVATPSRPHVPALDTSFDGTPSPILTPT